MNPILNMFNSGAENTGSAILLQALGAALRGESPQAFMKKLAAKDPRLKKMNLDDLYGSAQQLCKEQGLNQDDVVKTIDETFGSAIPK